MKYALIDNRKEEAVKGAKGFCPGCGSELIAKCGEVNINHWAHKGNRNCDPWWENETDWHRSWKDNFPIDWQEVVHPAENGEKHIADVKTDGGWVLEFQHSFLKPDERRSRNAFYPKLIWIVDGTRRSNDKIQFFKKIDKESAPFRGSEILRVPFPDECRLLKEWHDSNKNIFVLFDFKELKETNRLWFLFPKIANTEAYIVPFLRDKFIEMHKENKFDEMVGNLILPFHNKLLNEIKAGSPSNMTYNREHALAIMRMNQKRRFRF